MVSFAVCQCACLSLSFCYSLSHGVQSLWRRFIKSLLVNLAGRLFLSAQGQKSAFFEVFSVLFLKSLLPALNLLHVASEHVMLIADDAGPLLPPITF